MAGRSKDLALIAGLFGAALIFWFMQADMPPARAVANDPPRATIALQPQPLPARPIAPVIDTTQPERPTLEERARVAFSVCSIPVAPGEDPDGHIASRAELTTAKIAMLEYNETLNRYVACLEDKKQRLQDEYDAIATPDELSELEAQADKLNDAAVDQVTARVELFNQQLRLYNARQEKNRKK